ANCVSLTPRIAKPARRLESAPESGHRETFMDARVTLRSHLDRSALQTPHGVALADVIKAIAAAAIELGALIADAPLTGITGQNGGINPDGDLQKDIDVAADEMIRHALQSTPVAAVLSEEAVLPETL